MTVPSTRASSSSFVSRSLGSALVRVPVALLRGVGRAIGEWQDRRAAAKLYEFDDRMLADIGLSRADVTYALMHDHSESPTRLLSDLASERREANYAQAAEARAAARKIAGKAS